MSKEKTTESQQPATGARPDGTTVSIHSQEPDTSVKPTQVVPKTKPVKK